jgi:hypothetical protein
MVDRADAVAQNTPAHKCENPMLPDSVRLTESSRESEGPHTQHLFKSTKRSFAVLSIDDGLLNDTQNKQVGVWVPAECLSVDTLSTVYVYILSIIFQ